MKTGKINFPNQLSQRIHMEDIYRILAIIETDEKQKQELYNLIFDSNETIAYHAAWIFTNMNSTENHWLYTKQNELIDEVLICSHPGKRRLLLNLLFKQPLPTPPRIDFLDFCMKGMISKDELPGVKTLCMKLAYELCRPIPDLLREFSVMLEIMEAELLPISIQTVRKNVLKAMKKGKSLSCNH